MTSRVPSVLASGYTALDVVRTPESTWLRAGGTAVNVAANLAFLGWKAAVVATIGDDDAGRRVASDLEKDGVDTSGLELRRGARTPVVVHEIQDGDHRFRFGCRDCGRPYARHRPLVEDAAIRLAHQVGPADVFFFDRASTGTLRLACAQAQAGAVVVYEPASEGRARLHRRALQIAEIVKYSREQLPERRGLDASAGKVVIETDGAAGARFRVGEGAWHRSPAYAVDARDAGGAGDWMTAIVLDALRGGSRLVRDVRSAVKLGQGYAALSCLFPGARTMSTQLDAKQVGSRVSAIMAGREPDVSASRSPGAMFDRDNCPACLLPVSA